MLKIITDQELWYSKGLRFECTGCGKCCTGPPGYVWVSEEEIEAMAAHLKINILDFKEKYVRAVDGRLSLREVKIDDNYACIFLSVDNKCQLYANRPIQCQTFPWWPSNLKSINAWNETAQSCEGINASAEFVDSDEISIQLKRQIENSPEGP